MDYNDIDYDEGYSIRDIDNNQLNDNMEYEETNFDSDSDIDDYNYNDSTNNWSTLTADKINRQIDRYNNSLLDRINKKLESLEIIERPTICTKVERKNDSFLDLLKKMKVLNSEREFEPHYRSLLTKTMIDNWHNEKNSVIENQHINSNRKDDRKLKATERLIAITYEDNKKDYEKDNKNHELKDLFTENKDNSHIEIVQDKLDMIDGDKEKGMVRKGIVKEIERQNDNTLKLANIETLCKKLHIKRDIEKERHMSRKEIEKERYNNDSLEKVANKEEKDNSSKKTNSLKEENDERLKSIERSMTYTQDNGLAELAKKI